jgi:hypothetical protein
MNEIRKAYEQHQDLNFIKKGLLTCREDELSSYWENIYPLLRHKISDYLNEFRYVFKTKEEDVNFQAMLTEAPYSKCEKLSSLEKLIEMLRLEPRVASEATEHSETSLDACSSSTEIKSASASPLLLSNLRMRLSKPALLMIEDVKESSVKLTK